MNMTTGAIKTMLSRALRKLEKIVQAKNDVTL